jgi:hypothetical protein
MLRDGSGTISRRLARTAAAARMVWVVMITSAEAASVIRQVLDRVGCTLGVTD